MINKEQYDQAMELVEAYEDQLHVQLERQRPNFEKELREFTQDENWYMNDAEVQQGRLVVEFSNGDYDEDFSMSRSFEKFLKTLDDKYGMTFRIYYGLFGK